MLHPFVYVVGVSIFIEMFSFDLIFSFRSFHMSGRFITSVCSYCWFTQDFTRVDCTNLEPGSYWP